MVNPRLFELLEALTSSNLDWLADEVLYDVVLGKVALESDADVIAVRAGILGDRQSGVSFTAQDSEWNRAIPYEEGEQLDRAVSYVCARLEDAISMLLESAQQLDALVEKDGSDKSTPSIEVSSVLRLTVGDEVTLDTNVSNLIDAKQSVLKLKEALQIWLKRSMEKDAE